MAEAAFLMHLAEARLNPLETIQRGKRFGQPRQMPEACGRDEKKVAVLRQARKQSFGPLQRLLMPAFRLCPAQTGDILFHGRWG